MIVGAGKMARAAALALRGACSLLIANRTLENAQSIAVEVGGEAVTLWLEKLSTGAEGLMSEGRLVLRNVIKRER